MDGYSRVIQQSKLQKKIESGAEPLEAYEHVRRNWEVQPGLDWRALEFDEERETIRMISDGVTR